MNNTIGTTLSNYATSAAQGIKESVKFGPGGERHFFQNMIENEKYSLQYIESQLKNLSSSNMDALSEQEVLDLLKRICSKLLLNSRSNENYAESASLFPSLIMSLHCQASYLKRYTHYILSQIYWSKDNRLKNALLPVNLLEKETKSSDALVRADAIKMLSDMTSNLVDIFPFLYEVVKAGCYDSNGHVR